MSGKPYNLTGSIRHRIVERRRMKPGDLLDHPRQWRVHSPAQAEALVGVLRTVGITDTLKAWHCRELGGRLATWDGHLRKSLDPNVEWDVDITDLNDAEADLMLAAHDPLAAMAGADAAKLDELLRGINSDEAAVTALLADVAARAGLYPVDVMAEWEGMPEFTPEDAFGAVNSVTVHFPTWDDYDRFVALVEQPMTRSTRSIWFPPKERARRMGTAFVDETDA